MSKDLVIEGWKKKALSHATLLNALEDDLEMSKQAVQTERLQQPETLQKTKGKTAIIIRTNPKYTEGNPRATEFYNRLADFLRKNEYAVAFDPGKDHSTPPKADLWLGHSRGANRLQFATKGTKTVSIGAPGGINHPLDRAATGAVEPNLFHFMFTKEMKQQLASMLNK